MDFIKRYLPILIFSLLCFSFLVNAYIFWNLDKFSSDKVVYTECLSGPEGQIGPSGPAGSFTLCKDGASGSSGEKGRDGEKGRAGDDGPIGPSGPQGEKGDRGEKGDKGDTGVTGPIGPSGPSGVLGLTYGSFYDTTTQTNPTGDVARKIFINTTSESDGVNISDGSKISISKTGVYNIQFSVQVFKTDAGTDYADFWLSKNNLSIPDTNTRFSLIDKDFYSVAAWNFVTSANAGDYFELNWSSADTSMSLRTLGPFTSPSRPRIPSVILTVVQVK